MGCVSSSLLNQDEWDGSAGFSHHIVSLTSTTYGRLLSLEPLPLASDFTTTTTVAPPGGSLRYETINTWDLMSGLDPCSSKAPDSFLEGFEKMCPPKGENKAVLYTTTLRGVRKTFEDCNAVRSAIKGLGLFLCERDISMDRGFREELRELLKAKGTPPPPPPRLFVKGRYIGGVDEVMAMVEEEEGLQQIRKLFSGLPKNSSGGGGGGVCEGCGGVGFLPCFTCHGSCKTVMAAVKKAEGEEEEEHVVARCSQCNENGLVLCPICS